MDECCVSWPSAVHEHVEADRVKPRVCYKVPARTADSQPMRRQDRGDVGDDLSSKMEEIRMDASGKGIAWLQKKVETMNQTELRKMAAAVASSTRRPCGSMVPVGELRKALVEHFAPQASLLGEDVWFGEDFVSVVNSFFG